jgi:ribonuclease VapC
MIVVDASALIAILEEEPEAEPFLELIRQARRRLVSAVTVYETGVVIGARRGWESARELPVLLEQLGIETVPFAEPQNRRRAGGLQPVRQGHPLQGPSQSRRLRRLCARQEHECAAAFQGFGFRRNGCCHLRLISNEKSKRRSSDRA